MPNRILRQRTWMAWFVAFIIVLAQPGWGLGLVAAQPAAAVPRLPAVSSLSSSVLPAWFNLQGTAAARPASISRVPLPDPWVMSGHGGYASVPQPRPLFQSAIAISKHASTVTPTVGEVFTYTVLFTVPAGVSLVDGMLSDRLPSDDPRLNVESGSAVGPLPVVGPALNVTTTYGTYDVAWDFADDVNNPGPDDYVYATTYRASVNPSVFRTHRGDVGVNRAVLRWSSGAVTASLPVTITAPSLRVKRIAYTADGERAESASPDADLLDLRSGELITITVLVTNSVADWVSPAYNVRIQDDKPVWVEYQGMLSGPDPTTIQDDWLAWEATTRPGGSLDALDVLTVGERFSVTYLARVVDGVAPGRSDYDNTVAQYYFLPPPVGVYEREAEARLVQFRSPDLTVVKTLAGFGSGVAPVVVGDVLTYTIVYTFPWGTSVYPPVRLTDQLDDGLRYGGVANQPVGIAPPSVDQSGEFETNLSWDVFAVPVTFTSDLQHSYVITARVAANYFLGSDAGDPIPQGTLLDNEATLHWDNERGGSMSSLQSRASVGLVRPDFDPVKWKEPPQNEFDGAGVSVRFELRDIWNISSTFGAVATNVVVTDVLPLGWTFESADPPSNPPTTINGRTVLTWGVVPSLPMNAYLPGGTSTPAVYAITATAPLTVVAGAPYTNLLQVGYASAQGYRYVDQDALVLSLPPEVFKRATPTKQYFRVGELVTYSLGAIVPPNSVFYWPRHLDPLPAGVHYTGAYSVTGGSLVGAPIVSPSVSGREVITVGWRSLDNSLGADPLTFTVLLESVLGGEDTNGVPQWLNFEGRFGVRNEATLEWNTENVSDTYSSQKTVGYQFYVVQPYLVHPGWLPQKSVAGGGSDVVSGDVITYQFQLYNTGRAPAYEVIISDRLPSGLEFVTYTASMFNSWAGQTYTPTFSTSPASGDSGLIGWVVDEVNRNHNDNQNQPTQLVLTYSVRVLDGVGAGAELVNTGWISDYSSLEGDQPYERHYSFVSGVGTPVLAEPVAVRAATISKSASVTQARLGDSVVYTITLPDPALGATLYNVVVTDVMPASPGPLQVLSVVAPGATALDVTSGTVSATFDIIDVAVQETIVIHARVAPTATGGSTANRATVTWEDASAGGQTHVAVSDPAVVDIATPDVRVTKGAPAVTAPGASILYTVQYENQGLSPAYEVRLTDTLPVSVTYQGFSADRMVTQTGFVPGPLVWELGDLASGEGGTVWITATVWSTAALGTSVVNTATVGPPSPGDNPANNRDTATTVIGVALLEISKSATPNPVQAGEELLYMLVVTNSGGQATTNLQITDRVPLTTTFVDASSGASLVGDVATWRPNQIGPGEQAVVTFSVRVDAPLVSGTLITNDQYGASADNTLAASGEPVTVVVHSRPVLFITKSAVPTVNAGEDLVYTIRYRNDGNSVAQNLEIVEVYDPNVTFLSSKPAPSSGNNVWMVDSLAPVLEHTLVVTVHVADLVPEGTTLTNTVRIDGDATASGVRSDFVTTLVGGSVVYIPLLMKGYSPPLPPSGVNLTVQSIQVTPPAPTAGQATRIIVTLHNSGVDPVTGDFWVDLYVDPSTVPTINVLWNHIAPYGKAWFIHDDIPGGGNLVIHTDQPDDAQDPGAVYSNWPGWFVSAGGHTLYAQVDSFGTDTGFVPEDDETDNVNGPVTVNVLPAAQQVAPPPPVQWEERK